MVRLLGSSWWYVYQSYVLVVFLQYPMVTSPPEDPSAMSGFLLLLRDAIPQEPQTSPLSPGILASRVSRSTMSWISGSFCGHHVIMIHFVPKRGLRCFFCCESRQLTKTFQGPAANQQSQHLTLGPRQLSLTLLSFASRLH